MSQTEETPKQSPLKPYRVKEYADLADLSLNAVYTLVRSGELPSVRFGRAIRIPREAGNRKLKGEI